MREIKSVKMDNSKLVRTLQDTLDLNEQLRAQVSVLEETLCKQKVDCDRLATRWWVPLLTSLLFANESIVTKARFSDLEVDFCNRVIRRMITIIVMLFFSLVYYYCYRYYYHQQ